MTSLVSQLEKAGEGSRAKLETLTVAALIAFANAVEEASRSKRMTLACEHTKALVTEILRATQEQPDV